MGTARGGAVRHAAAAARRHPRHTIATTTLLLATAATGSWHLGHVVPQLATTRTSSGETAESEILTRRGVQCPVLPGTSPGPGHGRAQLAAAEITRDPHIVTQQPGHSHSWASRQPPHSPFRTLLFRPFSHPRVNTDCGLASPGTGHIGHNSP